MQKVKKISLAVLFGTVAFTVLYYAALFSLPNIIDLNKYKQDVSAQIEKQTGFKVSCENIEFKRSLTPYLKIHMYHTLVLYPNNQEFLKLKDTELKVKILPLLLKRIVIKDAKFTRPIINIILYDDFSTSIEKYINPAKNVKTNGFILNSVISDTICERYKLKIQDETLGKIFYLEGDELLLKDLKLNDKAHFILKGALYEGKKEYLKYDLDVISSLNTEKQHFEFSPFKTILESEIKGYVKGKLQTDSNKNINGVLSVDDLSLKIDNLLLKNNSINLIFSGQEVEIDASMHTSNTDTAAIKGKFNYGKKKSIDLVTKAKNINLSNLYKIVAVLSESLNIPTQIKDLKLKGILNADFSISSDFKKLKSNGNAKIENAQLAHVSLPYSLDAVNASINLENNKIIIENAQALVNSTPIKITGTINEDVSVLLNASSEKLNLKNLVKLFALDKNIPVELKEGILSFNSQIKGKLDNSLVIDTSANVFNLSLIEDKYKIPIKLKNVDLNFNLNKDVYTGSVDASGVDILYQDKAFSMNNLVLFIQNNKILIPQNTISYLNSSFQVEGSVDNYLKNPSADVNFTGNILAQNLASLLVEYINQPYKAQGRIQTIGNIKVSENASKVNMKLKANENNYLSYLVIKELLNKNSIIDLDFSINDKNISINNLSLSEDNSVANNIFSLTGNLNTKPEMILNDVKLTVPNTLTASSNFLGGEDFSLSGNLNLNGSFKNPVITGNAKLYYYNLKKYLTSIKNADVSFVKDNIRIIAPDVQINNSKFNVVADVDSNFQKDSVVVNNLQLNSLNLDFNSLYEVIEKESNPFAKSFITIKKGVATINKLKLLDLKARDISTDISIIDNILSLENINSVAYGGNVVGKINYDIPHSQIEVMLDGKNVQMKESLYDLCKFEDNISGIADFSSSLSFAVGDYINAIKSLNGKIDFHSSNGKMGSLGKFEYYLYAQNIFYHGLLNTTLNRIADALTKNNTSNYRFADGSVLFQNGYMITNSIRTTGNDMSLYVTGRHNLLTNQVNIDIYGRISDEIRNKLGSFGDVSISNFLSNQQEKKINNVMLVNKSLIDRIPELYNQQDAKTNTFKVNLYGDINSLSVINSFMWLLPKENIVEQQEQKLPDFSDMIQDL